MSIQLNNHIIYKRQSHSLRLNVTCNLRHLLHGETSEIGKARTVFPSRVHSFRMGKVISCLAFTWSRSHVHTTEQSYYLQKTISFFTAERDL